MKTLKKISTGLFLIFIIPFSSAAQQYYHADGGIGTSIIVVRPSGESLPGEDEFVLDFIQNLLLSDFFKFTAIYARGSNSEAEISNNETSLLLLGTLSRTAKAYNIEMAVIDPVSGLKKASYRGKNINANVILNGQVINDCFKNLVEQLDIRLTHAAKNALKHPNPAEIKAAINLARSNLAE